MSRNSPKGLLTGTTLGNITDSLGYNTFGEPTSYQAAYSGNPLFGVQYTRDDLGRISQKVETIGGVTTTYDYAYDLAGRLTEVQKNGTITSTYLYDVNSKWLTKTTPGGTVSVPTLPRIGCSALAVHPPQKNGRLDGGRLSYPPSYRGKRTLYINCLRRNAPGPKKRPKTGGTASTEPGPAVHL